MMSSSDLLALGLCIFMITMYIWVFYKLCLVAEHWAPRKKNDDYCDDTSTPLLWEDWEIV
jgi:hypothetical protein